MTDRQTQIAIKILQYLADNNNYERDGNVQDYACDGDTSDMALEQDYLHVRDSLEKDYKLIRKEKAELHMTPDGEAAQRIGFEKYLKKIKTGLQLDITIKWLNIIDKTLSILKESKTILIIATGLFGVLFGMFSRYAILLLTKIASWLSGVIHTLSASQ